MCEAFHIKKKKKKNIRYSCEEVKITTLIGVWETSVEELTTDMVKILRELELHVEPEGVTELMQSHDQTLTDDLLLLMEKQRKWFLEMEFPGEDTVKTVEMTTKDLQYYINLADKAAAGFERTDSYNEESSTVDKIL